MRAALVMAAAMLVAGCGGSSPMCQTQGEGCTSAAPCCSGLNCTNALCVVPGSGGSGGGGGGGTGGSGGGGGPMCGASGAFCSTMNDCCQGVTCPRYGTTCQGGHAGDPCQQNADCLSAFTCSATTGGWCTYACTSDAACKAPQGVNNCVSAGTGYFCFPFCSTTADCAPYPGTTCKTATDASGLNATVCST